MSLNKICQAIKKYDKFLISAHTSPEGDALGAQLGFYALVKKLGKKATIINEDRIPYGYDFLPQAGQINLLNKHSGKVDFDCFVVLDCADLKRTGDVYKLNLNKKPILNIDHHISNSNFGSLNWVDPCASSCSEMIYRLYKKLRLPIGQDAALALYTGIMTDTGSFHYSNTSSDTFQAASELLKSGINVAQVYRSAYENIPAQDIQLLLKLLPKLKFYFQGKVVGFQIKQDIFRARRPCVDLADQLLSFGRSIQGVEVVVLFKENLGTKNEIRVNLRSQGKVDVNQIAASLGGGGHKSAAGVTLSGGMKKTVQKVITKIGQSLKIVFHDRNLRYK